MCVSPPGACSYDISTIASVIPAFASRQDLLVVDDGVSYPIQQVGPHARRSSGRSRLLPRVCGGGALGLQLLPHTPRQHCCATCTWTPLTCVRPCLSACGCACVAGCQAEQGACALLPAQRHAALGGAAAADRGRGAGSTVRMSCGQACSRFSSRPPCPLLSSADTWLALASLVHGTSAFT